MKHKGTVYLVGAGPGDAGLLTLRGAELLGRADVVVYDSLVNTDLLRLAPPSAEFIFGGKRPKEKARPQEELNSLLISKARAGQTVVRLKGGDPYIFGRGGEEAEELAAAHIDFEVVPGISSAVAGPNYAGIPVTHRAYCSSFTVMTGHQDPAQDGADVDWALLAKTPGTKVILMGVRQIQRIVEALLSHGLAADTPVAMVRWGTTGQQQSIEGTLSTIVSVVAQTQFKPPAVTVIGDVVRLRPKLNWFEKRPLFGQRIVVTRARAQAAQLSRPLRERGAEVLEIPTIKIVPPTRLENLKEALLGLNEYDWIVFTSPNGVTAFFDYFFRGFEDLRDLGGARLAAVGPATAAQLKALHLQVDLMPKEHVASQIADAFAQCQSLENLRILLLRAEVASPDLPQALEKLGALVDDVACYRTVPETEDLQETAAQLIQSGADWLTFTSGSTVEHFHARFDLPGLLASFPSMKIASMGPETTRALSALAVKPAVEATAHTLDGLIGAVEAGGKNSRRAVAPAAS